MRSSPARMRSNILDRLSPLSHRPHYAMLRDGRTPGTGAHELTAEPLRIHPNGPEPDRIARRAPTRAPPFSTGAGSCPCPPTLSTDCPSPHLILKRLTSSPISSPEPAT